MEDVLWRVFATRLNLVNRPRKTLHLGGNVVKCVVLTGIAKSGLTRRTLAPAIYSKPVSKKFLIMKKVDAYLEIKNVC